MSTLTVPAGKLLAGKPFPQGATADASGTNFSLWAPNAERVELCLFDDDGNETRVDLVERTAQQWHGFLEGIRPGQRYGYRVHGPWDPANGQRFNPAKLLLDPYAKAIEGTVDWDGPTLLPYQAGEGDDADLLREDTDSAPALPKCVVADQRYDWGDDVWPRTPWSETVIYEAHVRGLTMTHPDVPEELRGTYAGLAHPAITDYLKSVGVTAVELLPVHHFIDESFLADRGLTNYWGYASIGFLAPHGPYSAAGSRGEQVAEFKDMVKALHAAGIEVILDVVFNHTAEGNHLGPTLSFKGIDSAAYYRTAEDPRFFHDYTGTGNSLDPTHPQVLRLIMDSLRYFALDCHVDGFRFDLAAALARGLHEADRLSGFLDTIHQDPILSQVKLIAEPWDVGPGGYQVGNFPVLWSEWNGEYRDDIRDFWRGELPLATFAERFSGSADLYADDGRHPSASINFVTAHDGFTLRDLVSYNDKHNEANLEDNQDGANDNSSWNCGVEGETDDEAVLELRARQQRNLLATMLLSQGVPMLLGGDELGRTQGGNNNGWCQDNEISWYDWDGVDEELLAFTQRVIALRQAEPVFTRRRFFSGESRSGSGLADVEWLRPDGQAMADGDWGNGHHRSLAIFLNGREVDPAEDGTPQRSDSFLVLVNAHHEGVEFTLDPELGDAWRTELATDGEGGELEGGASTTLTGRTLRVLRRV
ncbi:glycogen debranching protein GlgX [Solirubrobacter phytolaccae]|uniref:Glycogen debranching protein GlgX n=1 Tax=Solirubrobacter phytolaccae TaxID=1404360 RepID=A0A9X3N8W0_9ACTN|nr:glycogen debranching protein GlgX [Solirubrobacter phytolaccae]MDA0181933.1 glycogen debranching protein GlgX [Solirubrobacter phytolaccae]